MNIRYKDSFLGYFQFYYRITGSKLLISLGLSILISFLDGVGLAMFIPLLEYVGEGGADTSNSSLGKLHYLIDGFESLGVPLTIYSILMILVSLFVLKGIVKFSQSIYQVNLRHYFVRKVRFILIDSLQHLSYKGFLNFDAGRLQSTMTVEVGRLFNSMNAYFLAAQAAVMLATYVVLAMLANFQFAILVAVGGGLSNLIYRKIYKATKKASLEVSNVGFNFTSLLVQSIHNFKYLKATNNFSTISNKIKNAIIEAEGLNKLMAFYNAITNSVKEPIIIIIVALVIAFQVSFFNSNLASIILSLLLFYRALNYLALVQNYWQNFINNLGGMHSVAAMMEEMSEMQEPKTGETFKVLQSGIKLENVNFAYGSNNILRNINLTIAKNQTIAFVGESGSGKTTLANVIAGLIVPEKGKVEIDNSPLANYDVSSYRSNIGFISQDPVIFKDSIYNNITFWQTSTEDSLARFWEIVKLTSLEDFILSLPEKEQAPLGDNGIMISGGQKQRISIARELYKNAQILIMDEATSALDTETEKIIQDNMEKLQGSYTMIIIAHRLSTIKNADKIYLLDKGEIAASGTFNEVLEKSTRFKRMVTLQEV